ncbi:WD40 repeat domain-containing protein [Amycolatopsis jejuensis]|uniref:WD40 repeat domain-containing protein n=1 Tax=Amycolatopsis jejuensis TaxID=330084 RepID=UPI00138E0B6A|nr:WD40 repeat domain-containing protein [Amycolatopsis jejuensis]
MPQVGGLASSAAGPAPDGRRAAAVAPVAEAAENAARAAEAARRAEAGALLVEIRTWLELPLHPHLRACHGLRLIDGRVQVAAEEATGEDLGQAAKNGRFATEADVADVAVQLAWALQAVHEAGLTYGRLDATGAVIGTDGVVRLTDFRSLRLGSAAEDMRALADTVAQLGPVSDTVAGVLRTSPTAKVAAERLLAIHPGSRAVPRVVAPTAGHWNNRAISFALAGERAAAEECWAHALRADHRHPGATFNQGLFQWRAAEITDDEVTRRIEAVEQAVDEPVGELRTLLGQEGGEAGPPATATCNSGWSWGMACTPDGRRVVWGAEDGGVRWWDVGAEDVVKLSGHTTDVWPVAVTPDGQYALSGDADGKIRLWHLENGRCVRKWSAHKGRIRGLTMTADGQYAVSGGEDGQILQWDLRSGRLVQTVATEEVCVLSVAVTPDGRYLAAGGNQGMLRWWDLHSGQCVHTLSGHTDHMQSVSITPDGRYALSASKDRTLRYWDLHTGQCLRTITGNKARVWSAAISADGRYGVSGGLDRTLRYWDLHNGRCLRTIDHEYIVLAVAITADGSQVFSAASDHIVRTWGHREPQPVSWQYSPVAAAKELEKNESELRTEITEARDLLAANEFDAATKRLRTARRIPGHARHPEVLELWREAGKHRTRTTFADARQVQRIDNPAGLTSLALGKQTALTAGWDYVVRHWDLETGECRAEFTGHHDAVTSVAFVPDGRTAVSASADHTVRHWDLATGECLRVLSGHADEVTAVAVPAMAGHAVSGSADNTVRWWDLRTGECLRVLSGHTDRIYAVAVQPDGRAVVSGSADTTVRWWDIATGECRQTLRSHSCGARAVALTPDGSLALSGEDCGNLQQWQLPSGNRLESMTGHQGPLLALGLVPGGEHVFTAGADGTVRLRQLATGASVRLLTGHDDEVCAVAVAADGWSALSGSRDGAVLVWALDWNH